MTKPVTIPNTFATATTAIPLSQLDSDFSTVATALNDANTYSNYAADTGVANAYVVTLTGVSTTYSAGLRIQFKAGNANTGASTLNVNGGGTKNITFQDASALSSGTIAANAIVDVMYDGTQFLLMNDPAGTVGTGDVVGPASATANAAAIFDSTTGKLIKDSKVIITPVANSSTLTIANNKTVTVNNTLTLSGTDSTTMTFPSTSATIARTDSAQTFTGVQTFSSNPVLSGGTANGVLYLNGSKVATSGSALTFDGTNLGVGNTSSRTLLDILSGTANTTGDVLGQAIITGPDVAPAGTGGSGNLVIQTNSNQAANVGGSIAFGGRATDASTVGRAYAVIKGAKENSTSANRDGYFAIFTRTEAAGQTEKMRLDSSGNLGLGVTPSAWTPSFKALQVSNTIISNNGANDSFFGANYFYDGTNNRYINTDFAASYGQFNGQHLWYTAPSGTAGNAITFTQAMTLDASGNLLVGTTASSISSGAGIKLIGNPTEPYIGVVTPFNNNNNTNYHLYSTAAGAMRFYVGSAGTVFAVSTTISAISDQRLKENVQDLDVGLDKIMALKPRKFDWKAGKGKDIKGDRGFIAQEFEQVFPDLIDEWKDPSPEGEEPYKSVRADLIPVLVKAIQEQQALITSLTARVAALEGTQP